MRIIAAASGRGERPSAPSLPPPHEGEAGRGLTGKASRGRAVDSAYPYHAQVTECGDAVKRQSKPGPTDGYWQRGSMICRIVDGRVLVEALPGLSAGEIRDLPTHAAMPPPGFA